MALFECFKIHVIQHLAKSLLHFDQVFRLRLNSLGIIIEKHVDLGVASFRAVNCVCQVQLFFIR